MKFYPEEISVVARDSALSRCQVEEVYQELQSFYPGIRFRTLFLQTKGDLDQETSLLSLEKSDFFTDALDRAVLDGLAHIAIHSAKDLPDPLPNGLALMAYTKGLDSSDVLVMREGQELEALPLCAKVGTSSARRRENLAALRQDLVPVDIRGAIEKRLELLDRGVVDALIMARAALIRLKIDRKQIPIPGECAPLQGKLAVIARETDGQMRDLFSSLHAK